MATRPALALILTALVPLGAPAMELPWWLDSFELTPPGTGGVGAVTLSGTWIDTGAPDAIGHSVVDGQLHFTVSAPDLNVATGDALTPWTLTEEFGPLDPYAGLGGVNEIFGSIYSVDPRDRGLRELVSGPDLLGRIHPPPRGKFEGLGTGEAYVSAAYGVSADGRVVVGANHLAPNAAGFITSEAFVWTPETGRTGIGLLPGGIPGGSTATGVSADGNHVVGVSTSGRDFVSHEAFRWSLGAGMQGLGTLNGPSSQSEARAVSRNGRVTVGTDEFYPPGVPGVRNRRAFRYSEESGLRDLGVLEAYGEGSYTEGEGVSADGRVVVGMAYRGVSITADAVVHPDRAQPFRWTREGGMQGLGNLPRFFPAALIFPLPQQETIANAVSADGATVVGVDRVLWQSDAAVFPPDLIADPQSEMAVLWTGASGWIDLGQLRIGHGSNKASRAIDVDGDGRLVIGSSTISFLPLGNALNAQETLREVPFIWDRERGMRPLARVLAGDYGLDFEGWDLGEATAISDDGTTIIGNGTNPDGVQEAWRAVLRRSTRTGDANFDGRVDLADRAVLDAHLGMATEVTDVYYEDGDFDADGAIGEADMALLMANYDGRYLGDYNADGRVDAADYSVWRDHLGQETGVADGDGDGRVTESDLVTWRGSYGATLGEDAFFAAPEPGALWLAALGFLGAGRRRTPGRSPIAHHSG
ncbi:dockerin type I domain-containing protein [Botrimarina sp.]|uniref:dockerin type I domain-containing protein n=1 Tax=Botrimarina sp. TaxID=2795802 RepID=UPI0032EBAB04